MINIMNLDGAIILQSATAKTTKQLVEEATKKGRSLQRAVLRREDLTGANLRRADLRQADLFGAFADEANLYGANLEGANMQSILIEDANLARTNLRNAQLQWATLCTANLAKADLRGADLSYTQLTGANLYNADLTGAKIIGTHMAYTNVAASTGHKDLCTPLRFLLDQTGKIRAYMLTDQGGQDLNLTRVIIRAKQTYRVTADTRDSALVGQGLQVGTLGWVLSTWKPRQKIFQVEFRRSDIAAIPLGSPGFLRVHRLTAIKEVSLRDLNWPPKTNHPQNRPRG